MSRPPLTLYEDLGASPASSASELRQAYLRRLASAHPDKGGSEGAFHRVQAAYAVLSDADERAAYDERLALAAGMQNAAAGQSARHAGEDGRRAWGTQLGSQASASTKAADPGAAWRAWARGQGKDEELGGECSAATSPSRDEAPATRAGSSPTFAQSECQECGRLEELVRRMQKEVSRAERIFLGKPGADRGARRALVAAYVERSLHLHGAHGRLQHALFDAQEALRIDPASEEARRAEASLESALAEEESAPFKDAEDEWDVQM